MRRLIVTACLMALVAVLAMGGWVPSASAGNILLDQAGGGVTPMGGVGAASRTFMDSLLACERLQDSASKGHCIIVDAANLAVISKTTAATIGGGVANDTYLKRVIVLAALTGTCVLTGFADSDGTAQSFTIPVAFVGERNFGGAKNSAGALTITCSNVADDNLVLVEWWPAS